MGTLPATGFPLEWLAFAGLTVADLPVVPEPAYPPAALRYRALTTLKPQDVKVVILGQDPYHGAGEADGLAFSVPDGVRMPPSLRHIFQELADDLGAPPPLSTSLLGWAQQGVLLLNTALSVAPDQPASHTRLGWHRITDALIRALGSAGQPRAFVLWGKHAEARRPLIDTAAGHLVLISPHPSPFSARKGFFGSRPFSQVNQWLLQQGQSTIDWCTQSAPSVGGFR